MYKYLIAVDVSLCSGNEYMNGRIPEAVTNCIAMTIVRAIGRVGLFSLILFCFAPLKCIPYAGE